MIPGILILLLAGLVIVFYLIPAPKRKFSKLFAENIPMAHKLYNFRTRPLSFIIVDGNRWEYYSGGQGKQTILFIHGMEGTYDIWWNQIHELEKDYKIITFTFPKRIGSLEDASRGIFGILDRENIDQVSVVGTSMGGYIAQYLVKTMPKRIEKAVFGNTFPPNRLLIKVNKAKRKYLPLLPEILIWRFVQKEMKQKLIPAGNNDKLLAGFMRGLSFHKKQFFNRYDIVVEWFNATSSTPETKNIPKLIIESDNDPLISILLRAKLKVTYPEAQVHTFHHQGHFPYLNAMEEYNEVLREFLAS